MIIHLVLELIFSYLASYVFVVLAFIARYYTITLLHGAAYSRLIYYLVIILGGYIIYRLNLRIFRRPPARFAWIFPSILAILGILGG